MTAGRAQLERAPSTAVALAGAVILALGPLAAIALLAPALRVGFPANLAAAFVAAACAITVGTAAAPYPELRRLRAGLAAAITGSGLMAAGFVISRLGQGAPTTEVASGLIGSAGVVTLGVATGSLVGGRIVHPGHLTAVALASSAADIWSVHAPEGITHALVQSRDLALQRLLTVSASVPPSRAPEALIGLGDVVFAALYLAASARHGLARGRTTTAIAVGLCAAGAATLVAHQPLPALPFVGAAVVVAQPRVRAIAKSDRLPTLLAAALVAVALLRLALRW
jgi:hypothetical protein